MSNNNNNGGPAYERGYTPPDINITIDDLNDETYKALDDRIRELITILLSYRRGYAVWRGAPEYQDAFASLEQAQTLLEHLQTRYGLVLGRGDANGASPVSENDRNFDVEVYNCFVGTNWYSVEYGPILLDNLTHMVTADGSNTTPDVLRQLEEFCLGMLLDIEELKLQYSIQF
ncbi:hypothetical protein SPI_08645 [Niveomyces insectorum RCEF 264]|uniref:Uncharacterized protein n=1 Tax=Niveomyces insectorum RCEF 264 TaxID=1081102 RepID=A0A167MUP6_9HYPO|nr:hypothetical protein SPI_08645 [Niveomyces insectorum RCEF 264]